MGVLYTGYALLALSSAAVAVSDFRTRTVSILWLAVFAAASVTVSVALYGTDGLSDNLMCGLPVFLLLNISCMSYFKVRYGCRRKYVDEAIGKGDIVFLMSCIPMFPAMTYVWFLVLSSLAGLLWSLVFPGRGIPLAGVASVIAAAALLYNHFTI